eukprot:gene6200-2537_t
MSTALTMSIQVHFLSIFLLMSFSGHALAGKMILGELGLSCYDVCFDNGLNCNPQTVATHNTSDVFGELGVHCKRLVPDWCCVDQPSYEPSTGSCLGYVGAPEAVVCQGSFNSTRRICNCETPTPHAGPFGTGYSEGFLNTEERTMFSWVLPNSVKAGKPITGVMTHFWLTTGYAPKHTSTDNVTLKYYVDGEQEASIEYQPALASGVGFADDQAPWGTKWFGKGAKTGAWFWNFRVPFQKSIRITSYSNHSVEVYMILRGAPNVPIHIGHVPVPPTAKLLQFRTHAKYNPLDFVRLVDLPTGQGLFFMHTLSVASGDMNFLEGCYHGYSPYDQGWPGTVFSTGTEDFFDSAFYFNGGEFHLPVSGYTHQGTRSNGTGVTWSAYRFHEEDPIPFEDGFRFEWRNGDMRDKSNIKCLIRTGGKISWNPTVSEVIAYAWVY